MTRPNETEHSELSQDEKRATLLNDQRVREQQKAATFSDFANSEADTPRGRFTANESATVIGATPAPKYPAAFLQRDPVPDEPALGVDINAMPPCGEGRRGSRGGSCCS